MWALVILHCLSFISRIVCVKVYRKRSFAKNKKWYDSACFNICRVRSDVRSVDQHRMILFRYFSTLNLNNEIALSDNQTIKFLSISPRKNLFHCKIIKFMFLLFYVFFSSESRLIVWCTFLRRHPDCKMSIRGAIVINLRLPVLSLIISITFEESNFKFQLVSIDSIIFVNWISQNWYWLSYKLPDIQN